MQSVLLRFMPPERVKSFMNGDLWMSSLSTFWKLNRNRLTPEQAAAGMSSNYIEKQDDFSEGTSIQIPKDKADMFLPEDMSSHIINDIRFQIDAYKYCKLLCFCRLTLESGIHPVKVDQRYVNNVIPNPLLNPAMTHVIQNPSDGMMKFGHTAIIVKDEQKFVERIYNAINAQDGLFIIGDVRYHDMVDRAEPKTKFRHTISLKTDKACLNISDITRSIDPRDVIHYGVLDKYTRFLEQREFRVCWLPKKKDESARILHIGDIRDLIKVVETKNLRTELLNMYPGHYLGETIWEPGAVMGNTSYMQFTKSIESIDGMCRILLEIG